MFLSMQEPKANEQWQCVKCGAQYAEYVNGCPALLRLGDETAHNECGGAVRIVAIGQTTKDQ